MAGENLMSVGNGGFQNPIDVGFGEAFGENSEYENPILMNNRSNGDD